MTDISLKWNGKTYKIKEKHAFQAAYVIEQHATLFELGQMLSNQSKIRFTLIAKCYSELLNLVGANVSADDIHRAFLSHFRSIEVESDDTAIAKVEKSFEKMRVANEALSMLFNIVLANAPEDETGGDSAGKPLTST